MSKTVSVVVPAYNAAKYLDDTINSVLSQSYHDWELIIVNDGSTDNTYEMACKKAETDDRITVLDQPNGGVSNARNTGFKNSTGKYLAFLDADDLWLKDNLKEKVKYIEKHPQFALVHADTAIINENNEESGEIIIGREGDVLDEALLWNCIVVATPSSMLVKRDVVEEVGLFNEQLSTAADQDFFFRITSKYQIGRVKKVLGLYRHHSENMHRNIALMERDHKLVYKLASDRKLFKNFLFKQRCFSNLYWILGGSWWVQGQNRIRGAYFMLLSLIVYPPNINKLLSKIFNRK